MTRLQPSLRALTGLLAVTLVLSGCGGKREDTSHATGSAQGGSVTIGAGVTTGVFYQLGGSIGQMISRDLPGYRATASETGGSGQNIQGLTQGNFDLGFSAGDTAADAVNGRGAFDKPQPVQALAQLHPGYIQVLARKDAGINTIADMRGKRIAVGAPNSSSETIANRFIEAAGLNPDRDIVAQRQGLTQAVEGMKDGTVDALFWGGGIPSGGVTDLTTSMREQVHFVDATPLLEGLRAEYGEVYTRGTLPASAYNLPKDEPIILVPNYLMVHRDLDRELARKIVTLMFTKKADLDKATPAAKEIALDSAGDTGPIPMHPGAAAAYAELKNGR